MCCGFLDSRANIFQKNHQSYVSLIFLSSANGRPITVRFLGIMDRTLKFLLSECTFEASSGKCQECLIVAQWPAAHEKISMI